MRLTAALGAALLLLAGCTSDEPPPAPQPPVPVTEAALLAIAEDHLGVEVTDAEVQQVQDPSCPASYRRLTANGVFDGSRVGIELATGRCHAMGYTCTPREQPRRTPLKRCTTRPLPSGRTLVSGRLHVYQESTSWIAETTGEGFTVRVAGDVDGSWTLEELAGLASDPELAPRVDPSYVARGEALEACRRTEIRCE